MIVEVDYKKFQAIMNKYCPENPVTEIEAAEAFHNLADFIVLLMEIGEKQRPAADKSKD